jgi:hypothetical protein
MIQEAKPEIEKCWLQYEYHLDRFFIEMKVPLSSAYDIGYKIPNKCEYYERMIEP